MTPFGLTQVVPTMQAFVARRIAGTCLKEIDMSNSWDFPTELIIGLVAPTGVDLDEVVRDVTNRLKHFEYRSIQIRLSSLIENIDGLETELVTEPNGRRLDSYMKAGTEARERAQRGDCLALSAVHQIRQERGDEFVPEKRAFILRSLKHPHEVETLRSIYGSGFFLLGIDRSRDNRFKHLTKVLNISKDEANELIERDEEEGKKLGQNAREAFHLADAFISQDSPTQKEDLWRILDVVFGDPHATPTQDEFAMFLAFASSLRSADLSRQVGAVVLSNNGELLATGANDVPKSGGGLYWSGEDSRHCDSDRGYDSNQQLRDAIILEVMKKTGCEESSNIETLRTAKGLLQSTGIFDITEYGRAVHAEMEALLACARTGSSPVDGSLFCTTFPCHNCAKHIVASGIGRVVYIEPYPKSKASDLHSDSICFSKAEKGKVLFTPFVGIGPRSFAHLFSMNSGCGFPKPRKNPVTGDALEFARYDATPRLLLSPVSYLEKEQLAIVDLDQTTGGNVRAKEED